jgi:hypothetical protein
MFSFGQSQPANLECAFPVIKETVPKSKLGYSSNNVYEGFPAKMADGRLNSSHQQDTVTNQAIKNKNGIQSNWEYRRYLQKNANAVLKENFLSASNDTGFFSRHVDPTTEENRQGKGYPYLYSNLLDNTRPPRYADSDIKTAYLSREQLLSLKSSPQVFFANEPGQVAPANA